MTWEPRNSCLKEQTEPTRSHQVRIGVKVTDAAVLSSSPSFYVCSGRNTAPTHTIYIICTCVRAHIGICDEFDFRDNRCPIQPEQVITVRHRDFSGLVSKAWLRQKRHSVEGLKQESSPTFVIKKQMETKHFRLLVADSISWISFLLMFESCCGHSLWLPTLFSFYILYYRERQVQKEREEDVKLPPCVCLVHFFKQVLDDYLSRW